MSAQSEAQVITYEPPAGVEPSSEYRVTVNGRPVFVYDCRIASYASWSFSGSVEVAVTCVHPDPKTVIKPFSRNIPVVWEGGTFRFTIDRPMQLSIEKGEHSTGNPLHLFADPPETGRPGPGDPGVRYFAAGAVYDIDKLTLKSDETLYIEGGAIVRGVIDATEAQNIRITGRGIMDGTLARGKHRRFMLLQGCRNIEISGIILVGTPSWNIQLTKCRNVHIDNIKIMGWWVGSDGVDICATHDILIENSFIRANDDCIVVKCFNYETQSSDEWLTAPPTVKNVEVRGCVFHNDQAGNVLEIGYELRGDSVRDISFRDCDVIGAHGEGGVFTIHNAEWATVENVLYENIRVDHYYSKLVDFTVITSRYTRGERRGSIRNVILRNITAIRDNYNTVSLIGGYDPQHLVENVTFDNFVIGGVRASGPDDLNLYFKYAKNVTFS